MQVIAKSPLEPRGLFLFLRHPTSGSRGGGYWWRRHWPSRGTSHSRGSRVLLRQYRT